MLAPRKWLENYVKISIDSKELRDRMTMSGSNVEEIRNLSESFDHVVIGKVLEIKEHQNADKLVVAKVDVGNKIIQIVTGAKNFKENDYLPVALEGATLAGGLKIEIGELRGVNSEGMMCSHDELGIPKSLIPESQKDGLWILKETYPLGKNFKEILDLDDDILEFEITPNRPDCLNMLGIAREVSATIKEKLVYPSINYREASNDAHEKVKIRVEDQNGCKRYIGKVLENVTVEPSPDWMQIQLMKAGIRPINNIVDATNYVMLEYGQPIHAFDLDKIQTNEIVVKESKPGELFETLDGVERELEGGETMITDGVKPLAIGGVMGGLDSEVTLATKTVLIESANFEPDHIRLTSKQLNLRTEASSRFEKGVDPEIAITAANRVCQLIQQMTDCRVLKNSVDIYPNPVMKREIFVRDDRINKMLGTNIPKMEMSDILTSLEVEVQILDEGLNLKPPTFRNDLVKEVDFVEEVARIYGYDVIPSTMPTATVTLGGLLSSRKIENLAKTSLTSQGLYEVLTYSFVSPGSVNKCRIYKESPLQKMIQLKNPLGDETSVMRTTLIPSMMDVLDKNNKKGSSDFRAFEIGRTFHHSEEILPRETTKLVIGMYGDKDSYYTLKGIIEELLNTLKITEVRFRREVHHPTYHPGRTANLYMNNEYLGIVGEIHPKVTDAYDIEKKCYVAELEFTELIQLADLEKHFYPLPKYPSIERDIALVVNNSVAVGEIEEVLMDFTEGILETFELFDVYQGDQIEEGYKSIAYNLIYRDPEKTLKEKEVAAVHDKVLLQLKEKFDARLR